MRERKYVKFRVDMYDDTKFKIIDRRPERDLIHYIWNRVVVLAGKVNLEGALYLSKKIPYTIDTLAIEFNRDIDQVKLALDVLIDLEMIELIEHKIYSVKNFAKHQNIKVNEKIKLKDKEFDTNNQVIQVNENLKDQMHDNKNNQPQNKINGNEAKSSTHHDRGILEINYKDVSKADDNISNEKSYSRDNIPILFETKKNKKANSKKKKDNSIDITDELIDDNSMFSFSNGEEEIHLGEGECLINEWSF